MTGPAPDVIGGVGAGAVAQATLPAATVETLEHAPRAFEEYRKLTTEGRFEEAGARLRAVGEALARVLPEDRALPMR